MDHLTAHAKGWLEWRYPGGSSGQPSAQRPLVSVFFGGGTPSVYGREYEQIFAAFRPYLQPDAEISLEANPDDITRDALRVWRDLGFNRISIGIQTFAPAGLIAMNRVHDTRRARAAIEMALEEFPKVNADLIYGWDGQTDQNWLEDLRIVTAAGVGHLSLYNLTYELRTVTGRRAARGLIEPAADERLEYYYETARSVLANSGYEHEEVSNWSKPGHSCRHNWLYWSGEGYLGVGPGAHGYIPESRGIGIRYAYPRNDRLFGQLSASCTQTHVFPDHFGVVRETDRTVESWVIEMISSSLRTFRGVDLQTIRDTTGRELKPTPALAAGLDRGLLMRSPCGRWLTARPAEWFREHFWALNIIDSLA